MSIDSLRVHLELFFKKRHLRQAPEESAGKICRKNLIDLRASDARYRLFGFDCKVVPQSGPQAFQDRQRLDCWAKKF